MFAKPASNEIQIIRLYDASLRDVWNAWTDPEEAKKWWGPRGFTITTHSKELRKGGHWRYTMHGPDGTDFPNKTHYFEVDELSRLVYDHGGSDDAPPLFRVTVLFSEAEGKTTMNMTMALPTAEAALQISKHIKAAYGNSTWDRLAEYLDKKLRNKETFVVNYTFNSNQEKTYELWTEPKFFSQWMGPTGTQLEFFKAEAKPGGTTFYKMTGSDGSTTYGKSKYFEMNKPHELIYIQGFCDANEKTVRHPMAALWPEHMLTQVTFAAQSHELTRVTLKWEPYGDISAEELACFTGARAGMTQGWYGTFDRLEAFIAESKS
jgi:uncharacterized protein YndB with AHSA1/START domain